MNTQENVYCIVPNEEWQDLLNKNNSWKAYLIAEGRIGDKEFMVIGNGGAKEQ